jgi:lysozyme
MTDNIIDLSHWQSPVDFAQVAEAGIVAAIGKATQGVLHVDPMYAQYRSEALQAGLRWGSYHFGTTDDPAMQVSLYLQAAMPADDQLLCLDFESAGNGGGMTLLQARAFVEGVQAATGRWPMLYGGAYLKACLAGQPDPVLRQCPLWLAQYAGMPILPPGWDAWTLWQFTDNARDIPGVVRCDRSRYAGSDDVLRARWPGI